MKFIKTLILFLLFLILALGVVLKRNIFSKEVLKLEIIGPSEVELGKEEKFLIKYKNNGNFRLEDPELVVEFPGGTLSGEEILERKVFKEELGNRIYPGEEKSFELKLRFFGEEGEAKTIRAFLSYRPKNLKAEYASETSFSTKIKSIPFTFELDLPSQIEPEKIFTLRVLYFSNLNFLLQNLVIKTDFPAGFEMIESYPKPSGEKEWQIPLLNSFEGGRVEISGKIYGGVGEKKIFKAEIGVLVGGEFFLLKEAGKGIELIKPSIYIRQEINGNPEYTANLGDWLHYEIYFKNIGDEEMKNLVLIVQLEGVAFDLETIKTENGNYQPGDNSIIFDWKKNQKLQLLAPMEEGKVEFWIKLKEDIGRARDLVIKDKVFLGRAKEEFITKISTKVEFSQKGFFQDEVFGNSGPIPPKVGETTTYTIIWRVQNFHSELRDITIRGTLPENVSLTGKISPESEISKFSFDSQSREITWSLEKLFPDEARSLAFQISFIPKPEQRGQRPNLINETRLSAQDVWAGKKIELKVDPLTTLLKDDPTINEENSIVK